jgi:hypothetical protein
VEVARRDTLTSRLRFNSESVECREQRSRLPRQRSGRSFQVCPGVADLAGYGEGYWLVYCSITTLTGMYGHA